MPKEQFAVRLRTIHESWTARRTIVRIGNLRTFENQFMHLLELHQWAQEAVDDIRAVYGKRFPITLGPAPSQDQEPPAFIVLLAEMQTLIVALTEQEQGGEPVYSVAMSMHGNVLPLATGTYGRPGHWTRAQLEDILLSMLGTFERGRS